MKRKHCIDSYYLYYSDVVRFSYKWSENIALIYVICTILRLYAFLINETKTLHWRYYLYYSDAYAFLINETKTLHWYYYLYYSDVIRFSYKWNENIALIDIICCTLFLFENIALIDIICTILMLSAFLINETKTLHW